MSAWRAWLTDNGVDLTDAQPDAGCAPLVHLRFEDGLRCAIDAAADALGTALEVAGIKPSPKALVKAWLVLTAAIEKENGSTQGQPRMALK